MPRIIRNTSAQVSAPAKPMRPQIRRPTPMQQVAQAKSDPLKQLVGLSRKVLTPSADNVQAPVKPVARKITLTQPKPAEPEFKLDPSQQAAMDGLVNQKFGCLTGAAGTGKTTVLRILISRIEESINQGNIANYAKLNPDAHAEPVDAPLIAFCAYTGKAMQQMKQALPEDHARRCYTIHKLLGFHPIFEEVWDEEIEADVTKRRFVPYYTAENKMPWEVIVIDESSMNPIPLWHQLLEACKPSCRIYMIGDINQLPPVMGRSIFGFSLQKWPAYELTQIHRQKGEDNPIVENAWKILQGQIPQKVSGKFDMVQLPSSKHDALVTLYKVMTLLRNRKEFNPYDTDEHKGDMLIVPQNVDMLGQEELNQYLIGMFNPPPAETEETTRGRRQIVIAGFAKRSFAVGDKVMVTQNDHDAGITNGMTGTIAKIVHNDAFGKIQIGGELKDLGEITADELMKEVSMSEDNVDVQDKEELSKRAASSVIHVDFGLTNTFESDGFTERHVVQFSTAGQVNSLIHAYAATCHKMQGSEVPTTIVLCHSANHRMLYREWLYTAVTRAAKRVVLLYDNRGLSMALNRQKISGANLQEKAQVFIDLQKSTNDDTIVPILPEPEIV